MKWSKKVTVVCFFLCAVHKTFLEKMRKTGSAVLVCWHIYSLTFQYHFNFLGPEIKSSSRRLITRGTHTHTHASPRGGLLDFDVQCVAIEIQQ